MEYPYLGDRDVKVQTKTQYRAREENNEYRERSIFEVGDLDLHTPEFDAPTDRRLGWRRLKSKRLPIS